MNATDRFNEAYVIRGQVGHLDLQKAAKSRVFREDMRVLAKKIRVYTDVEPTRLNTTGYIRVKA